MGAVEFQVLNTDDPLEIDRYERALFRAFGRFDPHGWGNILERVPGQKRLRTHVPYTHQEIYVARVLGVVMAGVAVNPNLAPPLQLEAYGFHIDAAKENAEGLLIFSLDSPLRGTLLPELGRFAFSRLKEKGKRRVFGTCDTRRLRAYESIGFVKRDERPHLGDVEYLIEMRLD